ncbi:hypothetical protein [Psittacicella melopsittaci]|nr:hypothetical protein [Psittacicella melopsittaci]
MLLEVLVRVGLSVGVIFLVVILPLALVSRKAKIVRRYRKIKRANLAKSEVKPTSVVGVAK